MQKESLCIVETIHQLISVLKQIIKIIYNFRRFNFLRSTFSALLLINLRTRSKSYIAIDDIWKKKCFNVFSLCTSHDELFLWNSKVSWIFPFIDLRVWHQSQIKEHFNERNKFNIIIATQFLFRFYASCQGWKNFVYFDGICVINVIKNINFPN